MDRKKILQIVVFAVIVIVLGWLLWWMFWRTPGEEMVNINGELVPVSRLPNINEGPPTGVNFNVNTGLPGLGNQNVNVPVTNTNQPVNVNAAPQVDATAHGGLTSVTSLAQTALKDPVLVSADGQFQAYNEIDNKFYRLTPNGQAVPLSNKEFFNVEKVNWSNDANKAILEYPDGSNIMYDFQTDKQYSLPKPMTDFSFSSGDDQIAFKWISDVENDDWLGVASPDGSDVNFLEPLGEETDNVQVGWSPNSQVVATFRDGTGLNSMDIIFIGQHDENFKSLEVQGRGFEGQWVPDGKRLLYSVYSDNTGSRPNLWITRADGENIGLNNQPIGLNTWADKCTMTGGSAYCAVPENLPEGAAYLPEIADNIPDLFYRVDLNTGAKQLLAKPVGDKDSYTAQNLLISPDESTLYFTDKQTGKLYSLKLK